MTDIAAINYEPLKQMDSANSRALKTALHGWLLPAYLLAFLVAIGLTAVLKNALPLMAAGIVFAVHVGTLISKYKSSAWQEFAAANGWQMDTVTSVFSLVPPSLNYGHSQNLGKALLAQLGTFQVSLFTYDCTTGSGKYQQTHSFTVARVALPRQLPHMVLDSKKAHADVRESLTDKKQLKLEGDFDDYFRLFVESGQEVDVLQVLTPDVMQALISFDTKEDIEINGSNLYLILANDQRDYKTMPAFISSIVHLSQQITENIELAHGQAPAPVRPATDNIKTY